MQLLRNRMQMLREDAAAVAKVVEEAFRGESELDDDMLDPHLRQVFYDLQDRDILKVRRQEYERDGQQLRGYFWSVDEQERLVPRSPSMPRDPNTSLYDDLADHAWERRRQV